MIHEREREFRQRRFAQIRAAMRADGVEAGADEGAQERRAASVRQLLDDLARFRASRDLEAFRSSLHSYSTDQSFNRQLPGYNYAVAMFLNQLVKASPDPDQLTELLLATMQVPEDMSQANQRLHALVSHVEQVKVGASPPPKHAVVMLAFFWWAQSAGRWPALWPPTQDALQKLGWMRSDVELDELYESYTEAVQTLHDDDQMVEVTLFWFNEHPWIALDAALRERLVWAEEMDRSWRGDVYVQPVELDAARNIAAVVAELRILGDHLERVVGETVGRELRYHVASELWQRNVLRYRTDGWVKWKLRETSGWNEAPAIVVHATAGGVQVGLTPGRRGRGWASSVRDQVARTVPGLDVLSWGEVGNGPETEAGTYLIGREFADDRALGRAEFADEVVALAAELQPAVDQTLALIDEPVAEPELELAPLLERFLAETGYPTDKDRIAQTRRGEMAAPLQADALDELDLDDVRRVYNSSHYGFPGNQSTLNITLRDASAEVEAAVIAMLRHLLWGEEPVEERIDRCLDHDDLGFRGLGQSAIMKFLAVCHPDRFVPVFPLTGDNGRLALLAALGVEAPSSTLSAGARQMAANDLLRTALEPYLPGDLWGQIRFAYWVREHAEDTPDDDPLDGVVRDCYLPDRDFVDELVELLDDKKQIVLYGPPGTGKTFIARKLAEALAPQPRLRRFVQFHPSTSYEDFFEGYRPDRDESGNLAYQLQPGPFADLADHAAQDPRLHVLVIDELNRANIPKVFGELLFLLEYRDQTVVPLYRPEFSLPEDLWVIATMNTADRSIASLDAALRRRFHFVPIFPDDGPMAGVLRRYLEAHDVDASWADLVDMVNAELRDRLGSGDLLIGPSHFMKEDLDERSISRIWRYNVEPLMDDLFYGDAVAIREFRWAAVIERFRQSAAGQGRDSAPGGPDDPVLGAEPLDSVAAAQSEEFTE